jgi:uncharacterized protein involved in exopolysaccharide biosynthesis
MEVIAIYDVLRRHIIMIVMLCIFSTAAGYGISFIKTLIPTTYDASAIVLVRPQDPIKIQQSSSGKEYMGFPLAQTPVVESSSKTYIQIIQSEALVAEVVRKLNLHVKAPKKPSGDTLFDQIYDYMRDIYDDFEEYVKDAIAIVRYGRLLKDDPFSKAVKDVIKGLTLKSYEDTYVFEIKFSGDDPQTAYMVANTLAATFIDFLEKMRDSEAKDVAGQLRTELDQSRQRLEAARESLRDYKAAHGVFLYKPEYDAKLKVIGDLTFDFAKLDESLSAGTLEGRAYEKKRASLLKTLSEKRAELAPLPTIERELQLLEADVEVANTTYGIVAKELKGAEIRAVSMPEARLVSSALVPGLPNKPRRGIILGSCLLGGLVAGVALAFFLEHINRSVRRISDIEDFVGLKVIATIPLAPQALFASREQVKVG